MSIGAYITVASGRAICQICHKKIVEGQPQVVMCGYRSSGRIHSNPNQCDMKKRYLKK